MAALLSISLHSFAFWLGSPDDSAQRETQNISGIAFEISETKPRNLSRLGPDRPDKPRKRSLEKKKGGLTSKEGSGASAFLKIRSKVAASFRLKERELENLRLRGKTYQTRVKLVLEGSGAIHAIRIHQSSGDSRFDQVALEAVRQAAPFSGTVKPGSGTLSFSIPLEYRTL